MSQLMRTLRGSSVGLFLAAAPLPTAAAQQVVSPADSVRARVVAALPIGAWVRLESGAYHASGTIVERDGTTPRIRVTGGEHQVLEVREIETIWIQRGRATKAGMRTGALTGAVIGTVLGLVGGSVWCETGCGGARARGGVGGLAIGAGVGALVGAAVGTALPRWERLLP